jgi:phosphoserine phosphatase
MSDVTVTEIIAIVFDFDDTLMPDSMSKLLRANGIKQEEFWPKSDELIRQGYDQPTAYLKLLLDNVGDGQPLGKLTNDDLAKFGAGLDGDFFSGLPGFFDDVRAQVSSRFKNIDVEFYIISGGLQAIMDGNGIVKKYFAGAYGCQLGTDSGSNVVSHIKRSITFTEKTRYLFEINKGIRQRDSEVNPFLVNKDVKHEDRRIPLENIVYVGDGLTDIPCFSTVKHFGGEAFGVFDPTNPEKTKRALLEFLVPKRVVGMYKPRYGEDDELGALLRMWVFNRAAAIQIERDISRKAASGPSL